MDKTNSNLILKGWWGDITPHLKHTLLFKNGQYDLNYFVQIVTDERLMNVWLGKEAYDSKKKKERESEDTFNAIGDLVGGNRHLVIIRLGFLGYKNRAMAGVLKEALLVRQSKNLPTWIVETPDSIFGPGHFAYSEDVDDYIKPRFEVIDLTVAKGTPIVPRGVEGAEFEGADEGMTLEGAEEVRMPKARFKPPSSDDLDMVIGTTKPARKTKRNTGDGIA